MRTLHFCLRFLAFLGLFTISVSRADESVHEILNEYEETRSSGFAKVYRQYTESLEELLSTRMKANDLSGANQVKEVLDQAKTALSESDEGKVIPVPEAIVEENVLHPLSDLGQRHSETLARAVSQLNKIYIGRLEALQKLKMANSDLDAANEAQAAIDKLKQEVTSKAGNHPPIGLLDEGPAPVLLLSEENQGNWKEDKGSWNFRSNALAGKGDSSIFYNEKLRAPFELLFDLKVKEGQRPRIHIGEYTIGHDGYEFAITLRPRQNGHQPYYYERGQKISVKLIVERKFTELWVDDTKVSRAQEGIAEPIDSIQFQGGDGWSPGETEFSNIRIMER